MDYFEFSFCFGRQKELQVVKQNHRLLNWVASCCNFETLETLETHLETFEILSRLIMNIHVSSPNIGSKSYAYIIEHVNMIISFDSNNYGFPILQIISNFDNLKIINKFWFKKNNIKNRYQIALILISLATSTWISNNSLDCKHIHQNISMTQILCLTWLMNVIFATP